MMPVCHWIRALSIAASDCCMQSLRLDLERSTMPLDQWVLSVFWQGKAFFAVQVKGQFKILVHKKCTKSVFCLESICGSREIMFHVKLV